MFPEVLEEHPSAVGLIKTLGPEGDCEVSYKCQQYFCKPVHLNVAFSNGGQTVCALLVYPDLFACSQTFDGECRGYRRLILELFNIQYRAEQYCCSMVYC